MNARRHGGDLKKFAAEFGLRADGILDFSSNVTPLGLPPSVRKIYPGLLSEIVNYPDPFASELRAEIARHYSLAAENVLAGNGSMNVLNVIVQALAPKRALIVEPCFSEYRRLLDLAGAQIKSVTLNESHQFCFPSTQLVDSLAGIDFLILGHPNNPTGTALSHDELRAVLRECQRRDIFAVIDKAFADWCPGLSVAGEVESNPRLIVLRSLTKFYGLAGVRSGFGLGSRRVIEALQAHQEPWSVNNIAQSLSITALRDENFRLQSLRWFQEESSWFFGQLSDLEGLQIFPSRANFFLMKILGEAGKAGNLYRFCGEKGIYIRTLEDLPGLGESFFRISIRTRPENERILAVLREWVTNPARHFDEHSEEKSRIRNKTGFLACGSK